MCWLALGLFSHHSVKPISVLSSLKHPSCKSLWMNAVPSQVHARPLKLERGLPTPFHSPNLSQPSSSAECADCNDCLVQSFCPFTVRDTHGHSYQNHFDITTRKTWGPSFEQRHHSVMKGVFECLVAWSCSSTFIQRPTYSIIAYSISPRNAQERFFLVLAQIESPR